jgi:hypothetical protein
LIAAAAAAAAAVRIIAVIAFIALIAILLVAMNRGATASLVDSGYECTTAYS